MLDVSLKARGNYSSFLFAFRHEAVDVACGMSARAWCRTVAGFLLCVDGAGCPGAASGCGNRLNSQRFRVVEGDGAGWPSVQMVAGRRGENVLMRMLSGSVAPAAGCFE